MPYWTQATAIAKLRALRGINLRDEIFSGHRLRFVSQQNSWRGALILCSHDNSWSTPKTQRTVPIDAALEGNNAAIASLVLWIGAITYRPTVASLAYEEEPFYEDVLKLLEHAMPWPCVSMLAVLISNALSASIAAESVAIKHI